MATRLDTRIIAGRYATYEWQGVTHRVRITKVNHKSANCEEVSPTAGRKVRVGIQMLKVDPIERSATAAPILKTPHIPAAYAVDRW